jgi:hypothetical protein
MSDSDLRQALLGTWRLVSHEFHADGAVVRLLGDSPHGYLVYTPDDHVLVQFGTRAVRSWPGPEMLKPGLELMAALGFFAYCGTFEVRAGTVVHHQEFGILQGLSGSVETRSVALDGDRLILGSSRGFQLKWQRVQSEGNDTTSHSELRQMLLGTWRLINWQPLGDNPQGYLVYTPDEHVFVQFATRAQRDWPGREVLELSGLEAARALGFTAYCGTFEARDGEVIHHTEFHVMPSLDGSAMARSVALDGDRLTLGTPRGGDVELQRVH